MYASNPSEACTFLSRPTTATRMKRESMRSMFLGNPSKPPRWPTSMLLKSRELRVTCMKVIQ
ncbi:hypothetical protein AG1IA_01179 [Rhizoctonia solani AG-1 IA]|uniref:Uncharacterized protein n=1 Tax=Thanatephorus cucumeris (strain AG1-IA) TaxID=983506 RepID=L8X3F0_THACA|nr:hypothetical protein AG1IA_01179 [Rhizoctonia solani AG-1 IA]